MKRDCDAKTAEAENTITTPKAMSATTSARSTGSAWPRATRGVPRRFRPKRPRAATAPAPGGTGAGEAVGALERRLA
ncbi:MAG: hypothetical protein OHK0013_20400 [Sandaracinaceae bacterium]